MVRIVYLFSLLISFSALSLEKVTASIDKNPALQGESIVLEVIADDEVSANALDTSALLKDFVVGRTSTSNNMRSYNGRTERQTKWTTVLIPRRTGKIIIPEFTIKDKKTAAIALVVSKPSEQQTQQRDVYLKADISNTELYVQQHATLTIKLYVAIDLLSGSLSHPVMSDTNIEQLDKDTNSEEIINGRRYQIIERRYTINPEKSGKFTLEMPIFSGQVATRYQRRGKPISVISDPIDITVKPVPSNYQGQWLPSELITLHEEWQPQHEFMVGEPITRTVTLTAVGLSQEQLPALSIGETAGLKIYPDKPTLHSGINSGRLISQAVTNFAVVATNAGEYTLPEVRIPWFDTASQTQKFAVLPEKKIKVNTNPDIAVTPPTSSNEQHLNNEQLNGTPTVIKTSSSLQWLFLALWLLTLIGWISHIIWLNKNRQTNKSKPEQTSKSPYLTLVSACQYNQGEAALSSLLPWMQSLYPSKKIQSLAQGLDEINHIPLKDAVNQLQASYYGKTPQAWEGKALLAILKTLNQSASNKNNDDEVKLNP